MASADWDIAKVKPTEVIFSPDKKMAAFWVDADPGEQLGWIRTVAVIPIPRGDPVFSLVTFPRHTEAAWNASSSRCVILNAPDNGNIYFWLVEMVSEEKWKMTKFDPLKPIAESYYANLDESRFIPWRPMVDSILWQDERTLRIEARDRNGDYTITVRTDNPNHPKIQKRQQKKP